MFRSILGATLLTACWLIINPVAAHDFKAGSLEIKHPWARPTVATMKNGAAYMLIFDSSGTADRLVSATTPVAERVEFHTNSMEGGVVRMRQLKAVDVPAKGHATLEPGKAHLMLVSLKNQLKAGDSFPLNLVFEKAGAATVTVTVQKPKLSEHDDTSPPAHSGH